MTANISMSNQRPDSPYRALQTRKRDLRESLYYRGGTPLSRHHVIPYNVLGKFWNKLLVEQRKYSIAKPFLDEIANHVDHYSTRFNQGAIQDVKDVARMIGAGNLEFDAEKFDNFAEIYAWLPGNLFMGPGEAYRRDDPKENFEAGARVIVGAEVFDAMKVAYENMNRYVGNPDDNIARDVIRTLADTARRTQIIELRDRDWIRRKLNGSEWYVINQDQPDTAATGIDTTAGSATAVPSDAKSAVRGDPAVEIRIGDKTIRLTVMEDDGEVVYESGEADDISFRELADWAAAQFQAEVPEDLKSVTIRYLRADVFTTPRERTIQFAVNVEFRVSDTPVDLMADLVCTRTQSGTEFVLRVSIGVELPDGEDNHLWFDGLVQRTTAEAVV